VSFLIYLETNWIIGAVMGQDPRAEDLLVSPPSRVKLALPDVCIMEAISAFDWKRGDRNKLKAELAQQLSQLQRSIEIPTAQSLARQLTEADFTNAEFLSELFNRLDDYILRLSHRVELIPLSGTIVRHQLRQETELDRDDALILSSILAHSTTDTASSKAFLTGDINDFGKDEVRRLLLQSGIKHFSSTDRALGWVARDQSLPS
jgi:hypothetical protein